VTKEKVTDLILSNTKFVGTEAYYEAVRFVGDDEVDQIVVDDICQAIEAVFLDGSIIVDNKVVKVKQLSDGAYVIYTPNDGWNDYVTSSTELVWHATTR